MSKKKKKKSQACALQLEWEKQEQEERQYREIRELQRQVAQKAKEDIDKLAGGGTSKEESPSDICIESPSETAHETGQSTPSRHKNTVPITAQKVRQEAWLAKLTRGASFIASAQIMPVLPLASFDSGKAYLSPEAISILNIKNGESIVIHYTLQQLEVPLSIC